MRGYFEDLETYCGMGFDREENALPLYLVDSDKSVFVWNKKTVKESRKKNKQLVTFSYLWELCGSLLIAKTDIVSESPDLRA